MFRIDSPYSVDGSWSQGSAAEGRPGTQITADWLNAVQEELCNVVLAAGQMLAKGFNNQLATVLALVNIANPWTAKQTFNAGLSSGVAPTAATDVARKTEIDAQGFVVAVRVRGTDGAVIAQTGRSGLTVTCLKTVGTPGSYVVTIPGMTSAAILTGCQHLNNPISQFVVFPPDGTSHAVAVQTGVLSASVQVQSVDSDFTLVVYKL